jgi:hypothetical protein
MWSSLAGEALRAVRTRRQVWRNSFGKIQGQGHTAWCIPSPLPGLHDRRQSAVGQLRLVRGGGHGRFSDLGAEVASRRCSRTIPSPYFNGLLQCSALVCINLHLAADQTRYATTRAACRRFLSLPRCSDSISHQYCLSGSLTIPARSRILGSQTAKAPRPCSWQLVTLLYWDNSTDRFCGRHARPSTLKLSSVQGSVPALVKHGVPLWSFYSDPTYPVLSYLLLLSSILPAVN